MTLLTAFKDTTDPIFGLTPFELLLGLIVVAFICAVVGWDRDFLPEPQSMPPTVEALERHEIAADLAHQVSQQGQRQPHRREVGAAVADDARQGAQIPFAGYRNAHRAPPFLA